jgi:thioredoxin-related protein
MTRRLLNIFICICIPFNSFSQVLQTQNKVAQPQANLPMEVTPIEPVKWYTIEEAQKLCRTAPKKIMIDVYTDWCGWCKKMDAETFNHPVIARLLNKYFYPVKFNSETTDTVIFNGGKYITMVKNNRTPNPLAEWLLGWRMSYPTVVYLTEALEYIGPVPGYKVPKEMELILNFIAQDKFKENISLEEFQKTFVGQVK